MSSGFSATRDTTAFGSASKIMLNRVNRTEMSNFIAMKQTKFSPAVAYFVDRENDDVQAVEQCSLLDVFAQYLID